MPRLPSPGGLTVQCLVCGRTGPGRYRQAQRGDAFCAHHPWCQHCRQAHLTTPCDEELHAVGSTADALLRVAELRLDLQQLGVSLPNVPVTVVGAMPGAEDGRCFKATTGLSMQRNARIEVLSGLGPTRFGHVVAHEHTHALLHLAGAPPSPPQVEEGVCELVAVVWLTNRAVTPQSVLDAVWANPDPVYGDEMRRAVALARRDGVGTVLDRVLQTGRLE